MTVKLLRLLTAFVTVSTVVFAQDKIGALGRIVPENGIVSLTGLPGATIEKILVRCDQVVKAGDPLVVFSGRSTFEIELALAKNHLSEVDVSSAKAIEIQEQTVDRVEDSSAKDIELQKLKVTSANEAAAYAAKVLARLLSSGAQTFSANLKSEQEHQAEATRIALRLTRAEVDRLKSKREGDLSLAALELNRLKLQRTTAMEQARLKVSLAEANLKQATLCAPSDGTILEILQREGEKTAGPLMRMADLRHMAVRANVFQSDVLKLKPGMKAVITSKALPNKLSGVVASTGRIVTEESRVAAATIRLEDPGAATRLINLEVEVSLADEKP